jgi:thioester reductase-like protein
MSKRILVTGAGGFVGIYLIKELQKDPTTKSMVRFTKHLRPLVSGQAIT